MAGSQYLIKVEEDPYHNKPKKRKTQNSNPFLI